MIQHTINVDGSDNEIQINDATGEITLTRNGKSVTISLSFDQQGDDLLTLEAGEDTRLEGEMPGQYYLLEDMRRECDAPEDQPSIASALKTILGRGALPAAVENDLEERGYIVQSHKPYADVTAKGLALLKREAGVQA